MSDTEEIHRLKLICTNRGKHQPWRQLLVTLRIPLSDLAADADRVASVALAGSGESLTLRCQYCDRTPELAAGLARAVFADALAQYSQGRLTAVVDVSLVT